MAGGDVQTGKRCCEPLLAVEGDLLSDLSETDMERLLGLLCCIRPPAS
ncbi:MAG TPA: hypothetical protein VGO86_10400 [Candidatus Dormibacteraeota bacterium]